MITISVEELRNNFDKYIELGQQEEIIVTQNDMVIFTIVPKQINLEKRWKTYFGILPKEALSDDVDRKK